MEHKEEEEEETYQQRQENELVTLHSMFPGDIKDVRQNTWKVYQPPEFVVTILPQHSNGATRDVHVQLDLHVKYPLTYPDTIPDISISHTKGISNQEASRLKNDLIQMANELSGEVMIYQLIQHVRTFLSQHNTPRHGSFYDEMLFNQKQLEESRIKEKEKQAALLQQKEALQRKAIEEEMLRKQSALREESKMKKSSSLVFGELSPGMSGDTSPLKMHHQGFSRLRRSSLRSFVPEKDTCSIDHKGTVLVQFSNKINKKIQRGKCLGHKYDDNVVLYAGLDLDTGDYVTIAEWSFKTKLPGAKALKDAEDILHKLSAVEQDLFCISKFRHENLVRYLGIKTFIDKGVAVCLILQEFVSGNNLSFHINQNAPADYQLLQHYMLGILEALSFLHKSDNIHRDLKDTSVFVDSRGIVRLTGYCLEKRLRDIYRTVTESNLESQFQFPRSSTKKGDIYRLGILCLSLAQGEAVNSANPDIPSAFPLALQDFLEKCLAPDNERWGAEQLLTHGFMKPASLRKELDFRSEVSPIHVEIEERGMKETELPIQMQIPIPRHSSGILSRFHDEFEVINFLGKGGFGSVYKARNKLDCGIYAIKCIKLNPSNKQLNRKIMREVKHLSRLNHENVTRYYNSWLETECLSNSSDESSTAEDITSEEIPSQKAPSLIPELLKPAFTSPAPASEIEGSSAWSVSYSYEPGNEQDSSSSDEDEEDEDIFVTSFLRYSDTSNSIVFEQSNTSTAEVVQDNEGKQVVEEARPVQTLKQLMYIQMEFCDKNTLLDAISNGLYKDEARVWQLFREIVEGLVHIHQQGMIHRDLKPVNIFLDAHNHIKIGDFGLATSIAHDTPQLLEKIMPERRSSSDETDSDSQTGLVGTTLYIAPEVQAQHAVYNQKIDIYSLGIIFFEMCYPPLSTAMEKCIVLNRLRQPEITFPPDFDKNEKLSQITIIQWLLDHDPNQRPTSQELLQSKYLPPPQIEEAELQEMLRHTISNPQSKAYKHMISSLLDQEVSAASDVTYDIDMHKGSFNNRGALTQKFVNDTLVKVFERHGAISVNSSFLMPKSNLYEGNEYCVKLVDHGGGVVSLPHDLRVPFTRFIVKNKVTFLKRYHIAPVYRERKVYGLHPKTLYECAFDIVTPDPGSLIADAEVLVVIKELFSEFPTLQHRRNFIRLSHTLILKGILMYCDISEDKHYEFYSILTEAKAENLNNQKLVPLLMSALNISEHTATTLCKLISMEGLSIKPLYQYIKHNLRKGEAMKLILQGIRELEALLINAKALGLNVDIVFSPSLHFKNMHHFSGPIFQFVCELKKKQKNDRLDILAAGGRYDQLILKTRSLMGISGTRDANQSAVGVSIALERLVSALLECEFQPMGSFDVLVCALGHKPLMEEKSAVVRDLWKANISAHMLYESLRSLEEIQFLCKDFCATCMIVLKDSDAGFCRVRWQDKDRYVEKKVPHSEVVDFISQKMHAPRTKSESESGNESYTSTCSQCNITFVTYVEKLPAANRRRIEGQIMVQLNSLLSCFSPKTHIDIIVVELNSQTIKALAASLKIDGTEADFQNSIHKVPELYLKCKKYINNICEEICKVKFEKRQPVIILYGHVDNSYVLLA